MEAAIIIIIFTALIGLLSWFIQHNFNNLEKTDEKMDKKIDEVGKNVNNVDKRVGRIEVFIKMPDYATSSSPTRLTTKGEEILRESGIKEWLDGEEVKATIIRQAKEQNPSTAYDVQELIFKIIGEMPIQADLENKFKNYAFEKGTDVEVIKRVGAIYFRNIALKELGFKIEDLDNR